MMAARVGARRASARKGVIVRALRWIVLAGLTATLLGCGGGGGGGGGRGSGGVRFSLNPTSISAEYYPNDPPPELQTVATASGNLPNQLYLGAVDEGSAIDPAILVYVSGREATFKIKPRVGLAPGTYTGRLRLMACTTASCSNQIGNSPLYLSYNIRARQDLEVSPSTNQFTGVSGTAISVPLSITLPEGGTSFQPEVTSQDDVCSVADVTPTSMRAVLRSLPYGTYFCTLRVMSAVPGGTRVVQRIFTFTYTEPPGGQHALSATPTTIVATTTEGAKSAPTEVLVTPASWDSSYSYSVEYPPGPTDWVEVTPTASGYSVVANASNLPASTYSAHLRIYGASPSPPADVLIAVTVGPGLVRPADRSIVVSSDTTAAQLTGSIPINLQGGDPVPFTATSSAAWLTLPVATGTTGGSITFVIDNVAFRALPNGKVHTADVTVSSNPTITPVTFKVILDKRIGEIRGLGPYLHTAGQPLRFYIRGVGLSLPANLPGRLQLDGIAGANINVVNDTTLLVTAGPQASGTHELSISNALGLAMPGGTVKIIDPLNSGYRAIPTGDIPAAIFYDAERQTLYWAGRTTSPNVHSLRWNGSDWTSLPAGISDADAFGLTNDGSSVLAGGGSSMNFLDPQTLALQRTVSMEYGRENVLTQGATVPVTNDGLIWYRPPDIINASFVGRYNPRTGARDTFQAPTYVYPGTLPWFHVSRDGERLDMWIHQYGRGVHFSSDPDTTAWLPDGLQSTSSSDDGSRLLDPNMWLWSQTTLLGNVAQSVNDYDNAFLVRQAVISPDGRRVYALSYDRQDYAIADVPLPPPHARPRIYVLDATLSVSQPQGHIPVLGYFEISDFPVCRSVGQCAIYTIGTISPDGCTVFFAGDQYIVVVPVPDESTLQGTARPATYVSSPSGARMYEWRPK